jgi:hypothetical protein
MNDNPLLKHVLALIWLAAFPASAETINWYSPPRTNLTSSDQNMDAGFQFELGVFSGGFVPTANNISQWTSNWVPAQSAPYNATTKVFDSNFTVTGNTAPFTVGAKAYIWGRSTGANQDEWILFRKSTWTWPAPNPFSPFPLTWDTAEADQVLLGAINASGTPFLMKSGSVSSYTQWQTANLTGELLDEPADDPDLDSFENLLEFILGTSPTQAGAPTPTPVSFVDVSGLSYLQISVPRLRNRLATVVVEVSNDLVNWDSGDTYTTEVSNTANLLVVRDNTASVPGQPRRFMRLKATLSP